MSGFELYFTLGFKHIANFVSYDHLLFLIALCAMFSFRQWKPLLTVISLFTVGHTTSLWLAAAKVIHPPVHIVEFLIPVTIFLTAVLNIAGREQRRLENKRHSLKFIAAGVFGLIHGLGFSHDFLMLTDGMTGRLAPPLLTFTLGIEIGQLVIVTAILIISNLLIDLFFFRRYEWNLFVSGIAAGMSVILMVNTAFWLKDDYPQPEPTPVITPAAVVAPIVSDTIIVTGIAQNNAQGAIVQTDSIAYYVDSLFRWNGPYYGKKMEVKGIREERTLPMTKADSLNPQFVPTKLKYIRKATYKALN